MPADNGRFCEFAEIMAGPPVVRLGDLSGAAPIPPSNLHIHMLPLTPCGPATYPATLKQWDNGAFLMPFPGATQVPTRVTLTIGADGTADRLTHEAFGVCTRVQEQEENMQQIFRTVVVLCALLLAP